VPRTRPPYPEEFRREAIELARISSKSQRQIAEDLGISDVTLRNWVKQPWIRAIDPPASNAGGDHLAVASPGRGGRNRRGSPTPSPRRWLACSPSGPLLTLSCATDSPRCSGQPTSLEMPWIRAPDRYMRGQPMDRPDRPEHELRRRSDERKRAVRISRPRPRRPTGSTESGAVIDAGG
jgi:Sigma-70, region 4